MKAFGLFIEKKQKTNFFEQPNNRSSYGFFLQRSQINKLVFYVIKKLLTQSGS